MSQYDEPHRRQTLMEGFLIKQGHMRKNWKTRWFKLSECSLRYYDDQKNKVPLGRISLNKASLTEHKKKKERQNIFTLVTESGTSYPLQAPTPAEYNIWIHSIQDVITALESADPNCDSPPVTPKHSGIINSSNAQETAADIDTAQCGEQSIRGRPATINGVYYDHVFSGEELFRWIHKEIGEEESEAEDTVRSLLLTGFLECLTSDRCESRLFVMSQIYRLLAEESVIIKNLTSSRPSGTTSNLRPHLSSDFKSSNQGNEQNLPTDLPLGEVVKQGILFKRGHIVSSWKARCFVLQKFPATLSYFDPSKKTLKTINSLDLAGASVFPVPAFAAKTTLKISKPPEHLFCVKLADGTIYLVSAASESEMNDWVDSILKYCRQKPTCVAANQ